jgi:DNA-binding transcriptional MerR regulator
MSNMTTRANTTQMQSWGIRQFADMFDVTPRTIRFYEDKGLLSPEREAGTRVFGQSERLRFEKIMRAKRMGFSLDDIKAVLDVTNGHIAGHDELKRRRANFQAVIDGLGRRREDIDIMAEDMREIVSIIDDHLENRQEEPSVESLASKYEAAFKKKFAHIEGEHGYTLDVQSDTFEPAE